MTDIPTASSTPSAERHADHLAGMPQRAHARVGPRIRTAAAVLLAGVVSAVVFLTIAQEAYKKGLTSHRFNGSMGIFLGGESEGIPRRGLFGTVAVAILLALAYAVASRWMRWRTIVNGLIVGVAGFLGWGLVFGPMAEGSNTVPAGVFGLDADAAAPLVILAACLAGGITLARVYEVVIDARWWVPRTVDFDEQVERLVNNEAIPIDQRGEGELPTRSTRMD